MQRWTSKPLHFVHDPKAPFTKADLELVGVDERVDAFTAYVYFNHPRVRDDAGTDTKGYAASFAFFGHGANCWGDEGHCEIPEAVSAFDKRAESTIQPANVTLDVTKALLKIAERKEVRVTILAAPSDPKVEGDVLHFDELMLVTYS